MANTRSTPAEKLQRVLRNPTTAAPPKQTKKKFLLRNLKTGPVVLKHFKKHIPLLMICKLSYTKVTE